MARIRVFIQVASEAAYELKAQALNNDPRLQDAGIAALKFESDKQYVAGGEFADELPPPSAPEVGPVEKASTSGTGERLRIFVRMSADAAYELKAQALNDDPRLKGAGIAALKFDTDKKYIADGEFASEPPASENGPESGTGERLRVVIRMISDGAYELKAQALNDDSRLKGAGIAALKFETDKKYIVDGEFSDEIPSQKDASSTPEGVSPEGEKLRVVLRLLNEAAYELKAQALNNDPRLKAAGIAAFKFETDTNYIVDGEFSPEPTPQQATPPAPESKIKSAEEVRVYLRMPREDAYKLVSSYLEGDPRLKEAGISGVGLVKGGGVPAPAPTPAPAPKKRSLLRTVLVWGLIIAILATAGVAFAAPELLAPYVPPEFLAPLIGPPSPTATPRATETLTPPPTATVTAATETPTAVPPTRTRTRVPTITQTPTPVPVSCVLPQEGTILQQLNCRWGPGSVYIYRDGAYPGETVQIIGRSETVNGTWIYIQLPQRTPSAQCWISAAPRFSEYEGDVSCLEIYYPDRARELRFSHPNFPPPSDVTAARSGTFVNIYWTGQSLAPGDRPDEGQPPFAPVYLVEAWTCQAGEIVFTPIGVYTDDMSGAGSTFLASAQVVDEGGCSEPSHARVFLAHKDGYVGPVEVPWPP